MDAKSKKSNMKTKLEMGDNNFENNIYKNIMLSKYSWFGLGGPAEILFKPESKEELSSFLNKFKKINEDINIIGAGSNTLIRDGGVKGITIKLSSKFSHIKMLSENVVEVGAATLDRKLASYAIENSITNFEFLSCIPGSIGGGIVMNTGCYGYDISKILISIEVIDYSGNIKTIKNTDINFYYRGCDLPKNLIILSAKLQGKLSNKEAIEKKQTELIAVKKKSQPSRTKTCGSTFKNLKDKKAWELIKESNCDKMQVGDAQISDKHCNFFVNKGKATAKEIEELIQKVKKKVLQETGVNLELEIKIIGI